MRYCRKIRLGPVNRFYGLDLHSAIEQPIDPGVRYSVETPQGFTYTVVNPAAAKGSSQNIDYLAHSYKKSKTKRR